MRWKRVLLKLSGEALGAPDSGQGLHPETVQALASQVAAAASEGVQLAVVCGGGNILRGAEFSKLGAQRASADYMGMLGTVINALALSDALEREQVQTRVLTALEMRQVAEPFVRRRAVAHLDRGRVVLLAGGTGNPFFSTDTAAALRAVELGCEVLLKATKVDGVYTADPRKDPGARLVEEVSDHAVLDSFEIGHELSPLGSGGMRSKVVAAEMATAAGIPTVIASGIVPGAFPRAWAGERVGTRFAPQAVRHSSFKLWLKYAKPSHGRVLVDAGAGRALRERGTSLLPVGIVEVEGDFQAGDGVDVAAREDGQTRGEPIGKGIVNYSATELRRIKGLKTDEVAQLLPRASAEAVHRDYFVLE